MPPLDPVGGKFWRTLSYWTIAILTITKILMIKNSVAWVVLEETLAWKYFLVICFEEEWQLSMQNWNITAYLAWREPKSWIDRDQQHCQHRSRDQGTWDRWNKDRDDHCYLTPWVSSDPTPIVTTHTHKYCKFCVFCLISLKFLIFEIALSII